MKVRGLQSHSQMEEPRDRKFGGRILFVYSNDDRDKIRPDGFLLIFHTLKPPRGMQVITKKSTSFESPADVSNEILVSRLPQVTAYNK